MISSAVIDVFEKEPYIGLLKEKRNCLRSQYLGSCKLECRLRMESEALNEAFRWLQGNPLQQEVTDDENAFQAIIFRLIYFNN